MSGVSGFDGVANPREGVAGVAAGGTAGGAGLGSEAVAAVVAPDPINIPDLNAAPEVDPDLALDVPAEPVGEVLAAAALETAGVLPFPDSDLLPDPAITAPNVTNVVPVAAPTLRNVVPTAAPVEAPEPDAAPEDTVAVDTDPDFTKRYIQIGLFSVQDNATRSSARLRDVGILPLVVEDSSNGSPYWRVLAGPSPSTEERTVLLAKVKALGYSDAYYVAE